MTALTPPRHPLVESALADARTWCTGRIIDDRPAFVHAVRVAVELAEHVPHVSPELIAATLLHDSPELAPSHVDLDQLLQTRYGHEVHRIVRVLEAEHLRLDQPDPPVAVDDFPVLLASTADRIVAFTSLLRRARLSGDPAEFFTSRRGLVGLLPHFRDCHQASQGRVPPTMHHRLCHLLTQLERAAAPTLDPPR